VSAAAAEGIFPRDSQHTKIQMDHLKEKPFQAKNRRKGLKKQIVVRSAAF
jgi:hypothetical protein